MVILYNKFSERRGGGHLEELLDGSLELAVGTRVKGTDDYLLEFHSHDHNELVLLHGGNCRFLVGNQFYNLRPGNLLMLDGNTIHKAYVYGDADFYERSLLHFKTEWIQPILEELGVTNLLELFKENKSGLIRHFSKQEEAVLENRMREIEFISNRLDEKPDILDAARLKLLVAQLLIFIYQSDNTLIRKEETDRDEKTKLVEHISNYLFANFDQPVTIDGISREVGLTKSYMSHLFKEVTGHTIMNYLMAYRLSQARKLLVADQSESIKEIAYRCGFRSESHFSRFFKKNIGQTPSEYRINQQIIFEERGEL